MKNQYILSFDERWAAYQKNLLRMLYWKDGQPVTLRSTFPSEAQIKQDLEEMDLKRQAGLLPNAHYSIMPCNSCAPSQDHKNWTPSK